MLDVAVIGAGPAGLATAIQLKLYDIDCILYEQNEVGGLLRNANLVENYPGFPQGITGIDLIKLFKLQLNRINVSISPQRIKLIDVYKDGFALETEQNLTYCRHVVLASGTVPKKISIDGIDTQSCERVLTEIHTLLMLESLHVSIIGAGDAAFDYALNLSKRNKVSIHNRSKHTKCLSHLYNSALANSDISYYYNSKINRVLSHKEHLKIEWDNSGDLSTKKADYLIIAIGREPNISCLSTDVYEQMSDLEKRGKFLLVGDVTNGINRQTGISVGDGIAAAMKLNKLLKE